MMNLEKWINTPALIIGAACTIFLGAHDTLAHVLMVLMIIDYASGILGAVINKNLNSKMGFTGIAKKVLMLLIIAAAVEINKLIPDVEIRTLVIYFYIANEGLSIIENSGKIIPFPPKLKAYFEQLREG